MWNTAGGCPVTHLFNIQARGLLLVATTASLFTFFPLYTWSEKPPPTSHTYHRRYGSCTPFSPPITPGRPDTENWPPVLHKGLREEGKGGGSGGRGKCCVGGFLCICFSGCAYLHDHVGVVACMGAWLLPLGTFYEDSHVTKRRDLRVVITIY